MGLEKFTEYLNWKYHFLPRKVKADKEELRDAINQTGIQERDIRKEYKGIFNELINQNQSKMKNLKEVGQELNNILFDESKKDKGWINIESKPAQLKKAVINAAKLLEPEDEISEGTVQLLKNFGIELPSEESEKEEPEESKPKLEEKPAPKKEKKAKSEKQPVKTSGKKTKPTVENKKTKKTIVQEQIAKKEGATIEEIAQVVVDEEIDFDFEKNKRVTKLWLSKMGFNIKKAAVQENPKFKSKQ